MIELVPSTTVGIWGPVSSGKSYLTKQLMAAQPRVIIFDTVGDYVGDESYTHVWGNPRELAAYLKENPYYYRIAYHPEGETGPNFEWIYKAAWVMDAPRWLVIEEVHEVCGQHSPMPEMKDILRYSRKRFLGVLGASQRIAEVNKAFTDASRLTILFYTQEATSLDAIAARWGNETAEAVAQLRPLVYRDDPSNPVTEQIPECVVIERGEKPRVYDLSTWESREITVQESTPTWHKDGQEAPATPAARYSGQPSGSPESKSLPSTDDSGNPQ